MIYLTTHSTLYLRLYSVRHRVKDHSVIDIDYSFRLTATILLYASSHRQDNTYHSLCYTSRGALAGTRNSSMGRLKCLSNALSSLIIVLYDQTGLGRSLTSLVALYLFNNLGNIASKLTSNLSEGRSCISHDNNVPTCHLWQFTSAMTVVVLTFNATWEEKVRLVIIINLISTLLRVYFTCIVRVAREVNVSTKFMLFRKMAHVNKSFRKMLCFLDSLKYRYMNWVLLN